MTLYNPCHWRETPDGAWRTDCEHLFEFTEDGPEENEFQYCPFCSERLKAVPFVEIDEP